MNSIDDIAKALQDGIASGAYPCGTRIPSERTLADTFEVSRATIRSAIDILVDTGRLKRVHGKGTFVMQTDIDDAAIHFKGMNELLSRAGYEPSSSILRTQLRSAGFCLSRIFDVPESSELFQIVRLRSGNGVPISVENTFTIPSLIKGIESIDFKVYSLYDTFRMNHVEIQHINQKLSSTRARQSNARALGTAEGTPSCASKSPRSTEGTTSLSSPTSPFYLHSAATILMPSSQTASTRSTTRASRDPHAEAFQSSLKRR